MLETLLVYVALGIGAGFLGAVIRQQVQSIEVERLQRTQDGALLGRVAGLRRPQVCITQPGQEN